MNENYIVMSFFMLELTDGFQKWLTFDIAYSSSDFNDCYFCILSSRIAIKARFYFVSNMRNNLYSSSTEISASFFLKYGPVDFTSRNIGIFTETFIDKTLIMTKIKICLSSVISYKYFAMLYRVHSTWINVDIRVKFLHSHGITTSFQKTT